MITIAFISTCKGRLHHVQQSLPTIISQRPDQIIVVDYGCPDRVGEWLKLNHPDVAVVSVNDDPQWCVARARNMGAAQCAAEWICFIDADVKINPDCLEWMRANLDPRFFYRASKLNGPKGRELWGTFMCPREAFERVGGYDEVYKGWGVEDTDLYHRLALFGLSSAVFPGILVEGISHGDDERLRFCPVNNRMKSHITNRLYMEAKIQIMTVQGRRDDLPLRDRHALMTMIQERLEPWFAGTIKEVPTISVRASGHCWLPEPYQIQKRVYINLSPVSHNFDGAANVQDKPSGLDDSDP